MPATTQADDATEVEHETQGQLWLMQPRPVETGRRHNDHLGVVDRPYVGGLGLVVEKASSPKMSPGCNRAFRWQPSVAGSTASKHPTAITYKP